MADLSREEILTGAYIAGLPESEGLTPDEVADGLLVARSKKESEKKRIIQERSRNFQARRAERAGNQQAAEDFLAEDTRRFQSTGSFEEQERYPDPFGIPVSGADPDTTRSEVSERGVTPAERQRGGYVNVDRGRGRQRMWRERGQLVSEPKYAKNKLPDFSDPFVETPTAPQAAGMGGPNGLATQLADMVARGEVDPEALIPGSSTKTIGALINEMAMEADPQLRAEADKEIGRQTAKRDATRLSSDEVQSRTQLQLRSEFQGNDTPGSPIRSMPVGAYRKREQQILESLGASRETSAARAISDAAAEREAIGYIANNDNGLSDIQRIESLGLASKKMNKSGVNNANFSVTPAVDPNTFDDAIAMIGPDGSTVGYVDNQDRFIADVNLPGTDNTNNAPLSRTATWMEANLPSFGKEGGTTFGAEQVNAGNELRMLNQRLGKFGLATGIRGIDDLEKVVRAVTVDAAFSGRGMYNYDPEKGKAIFVRNPGIDEVLYGLDYTEDEKRRLAASLQSVEAAMRSPVNSLTKELYAAGIPSESQDRAIRGFEKDVQLSRITDERIGRDNKKTGEKRVSVRKELKALDPSPERVFKGRDPSTIYAITPDGQSVLLPDAQQDLIDARLAQSDAPKPFQAAVEGSRLDKENNRDPERARFVSKGVYKMSPEQRAERFGPKGAEVANEVIRRAIEDKQIRSAASEQQDPIAAEFRARDAKFEAAGKARDAADNAREVNEAFERMGISLEGKGQMLLGGQVVPDSRKSNVPERNVVPQGPLQSGMTVGERKLQDLGITTSAQQSTSPLTSTIREAMAVVPIDGFSMPSRDPVDSQKEAPNQAPLAGISYNETAPDPWTTQPATGNGVTQERERRMSKDMLNTLAGLNSGPAQGPVPGSARKQFTDRARNFGKSPKYERANRYGRRSAYVGGAVAGLAGLDGLINGERSKREEEQYQ